MTRSMRTRFGGEGGEKDESAEPSFLDDEYHYRVAPRKVLHIDLIACSCSFLLIASIRSRARRD